MSYKTGLQAYQINVLISIMNTLIDRQRSYTITQCMKTDPVPCWIDKKKKSGWALRYTDDGKMFKAVKDFKAKRWKTTCKLPTLVGSRRRLKDRKNKHKVFTMGKIFVSRNVSLRTQNIQLDYEEPEVYTTHQ